MKKKNFQQLEKFQLLENFQLLEKIFVSSPRGTFRAWLRGYVDLFDKFFPFNLDEPTGSYGECV